MLGLRCILYIVLQGPGPSVVSNQAEIGFLTLIMIEQRVAQGQGGLGEFQYGKFQRVPSLQLRILIVNLGGNSISMAIGYV